MKKRTLLIGVGTLIVAGAIVLFYNPKTATPPTLIAIQKKVPGTLPKYEMETTNTSATKQETNTNLFGEFTGLVENAMKYTGDIQERLKGIGGRERNDLQRVVNKTRENLQRQAGDLSKQLRQNAEGLIEKGDRSKYSAVATTVNKQEAEAKNKISKLFASLGL